MTMKKTVIEKLKAAEPEVQLKHALTFALAGDWHTVKSIGGIDLVKTTARKISILKEIIES